VPATLKSLPICLGVALLLGLSAAPARAQGDDVDDHAALKPAEPDYSVVNLPTTLALPKAKSNFHMTHRFNGNLRSNSFGDNVSNLFGLDQGASVGFEYRFGVTQHLQAIAARTNIGKVIQFTAKYDAVHQTVSSPVALSAIAAVEGENNFRVRYSPSLGVALSRTWGDRLAMHAVPFWAHRSGADGGVEHDTFVLGLGARVRIGESAYVVGEVSPRLAGFAAGDPEFAFGLEKRVGGHVFQLTFANTQGVTLGQLAGGGNPESLYLGFNLTRKFF
jgi:hypothetical protein